MKKFITLMTIAMVAILAASCGTANKASKAQKTDADGRSNTSQWVSDMQALSNANSLAVMKDHSDVSTTVTTKATQRNSGGSTHEESRTEIVTVVTSQGRVEGASYDLKTLKGRELEGYKYGTSVKMEGGEVYDENYYNSDNH